MCVKLQATKYRVVQRGWSPSDDKGRGDEKDAIWPSGRAKEKVKGTDNLLQINE